MTKREAIEKLRFTKIFCTSNEDAKAVQKKLSKLNIKLWAIRPYLWALFISADLELTHANQDLDYWLSKKHAVISVKDFLSWEIEEENCKNCPYKKKFDFSTLQPFDKVLVRDHVNGDWLSGFYDSYCDCAVYPYKCVNTRSYKYCIPYNEETKHLHNTTLEEPDFYKQN